MSFIVIINKHSGEIIKFQVTRHMGISNEVLERAEEGKNYCERHCRWGFLAQKNKTIKERHCRGCWHSNREVKERIYNEVFQNIS